MTGTNTKLTTVVETYFADLGRVRASGGATGERSSYGPLANLLNAVGAAEAFAKSTEWGRELARLLVAHTPVSGVIQGILRAEIAALAVASPIDQGT